MTTTLTTTGITFNDGTTQTSAAAGGGFSAYSAYSTSGSFTVPSGITKIQVILAGGGGAGGGGNPAATGGDTAQGTGGRGGGAGVLLGANIAVTPGQVIAFTIGAGGAGSDTTSGSPGGTSRFPSAGTLNGGYLECYGGGGGIKPPISGSANVGANGADGGVLRSVIEGSDNIWTPYQFYLQNYLPVFLAPAGSGTYTQWNYLRQMGQDQASGNGNSNPAALVWVSTTVSPRMGAWGSGGSGSQTSGGVSGGCLIVY